MSTPSRNDPCPCGSGKKYKKCCLVNVAAAKNVPNSNGEIQARFQNDECVAAPSENCSSEPFRLHIGGREPRHGWKIINIQPGPYVDYVGSCTSLQQFADNTIDEVYASHVLEHLGFRDELPKALREIWRVLKPGGTLKISVPDFEILCSLFINPKIPKEQKFSLMMHVFGAQEDNYDFHKVGLTRDFLCQFLKQAGFSGMKRVDEFGLFNDYSSFRRFGILISLNLEVLK
jgi:predicted SAM-dependent methyltransferase